VVEVALPIPPVCHPCGSLGHQRAELIRHSDLDDSAATELHPVDVPSPDRLLAGGRLECRAAIQPRTHPRRQVIGDHEVDLSAIAMPESVSMLLVAAESESDGRERGSRLREAGTIR